MTSLFTSFDFGSFMWCSSSVFIMISININPLYKMPIFHETMKLAMDNLMKFFLSLKPKMFSKHGLLIFTSVHVIITILSWVCVFSYNFPEPSQVSFIISCALGVWSSFTLFSLVTNFKGYISHMVPEGTPLMLTILIFLIEIVSMVIRSLTLTVRLVANILAGHLLMSLLSSLVFIFPPTFIMYFFLNTAELLVALIQAYIFATMTALYFSEI